MIAISLAQNPPDYLLGLGTSATSMQAIALAVLVFLSGRAISQSRTEVGAFAIALLGVAAFAVYALGCGLVAWWVWVHRAGGPSTFLFGWPRSTWFAIVFAPPAAFSVICFIVSASVLVRRLLRRVMSSP